MQDQKGRTANEISIFQLGLASQNDMNVRQVLHDSVLLTLIYRAVRHVIGWQ